MKTKSILAIQQKIVQYRCQKECHNHIKLKNIQDILEQVAISLDSERKKQIQSIDKRLEYSTTIKKCGNQCYKMQFC